MKARAMSLLIAVSLAQLLTQPPALGLNQFEEFHSYPYLDKAYRAAEQRDWAQVQQLMEHLISQVPENVEAYRLLAQALAKQGNLDGAMAALGALDANVAAVQINALRQAWIADGHASEGELTLWLSETSGSAREALWSAQANYLRATRGARAALEWLATVPARQDALARDRYRAALAEQIQDWNGVIDALVPHAMEDTLNDDDWRRLSIAMIQTDDARGINALIARLPEGDVRHFVLRAGADRAIALGYSGIAQRWLATLEQSDQLDASDTRKLLQTSLAVGDTDRVRQMASRQDMDCLTLVSWLSDHGDPEALSTFTECDAKEDPQSWLILADRLDALELLETTELPEAWHQRRDRVLLDRYRADGLDDKALRLLTRQPQTPAILRERAELTQRLGRPEAAELWQQHYHLTGDSGSLEQASYLYLASQRPQAARRLLEQAFKLAPERLSATSLARLAQLYADDNAGVTDSTLEALVRQPRLADTERNNLLEQLARHDRCPVVRSVADASTPPWAALGICSQDRPAQAAAYLQRALTQLTPRQPEAGAVTAAMTQPEIQARKRLAFALFAAGDPDDAWRQWRAFERDGASDGKLDQTDRLAGARSALASGDTEGAWRWWPEDSDSPEARLLGARIALARHDDAGAVALARGAVAAAGGKPKTDAAILEGASQVARQAGDPTLARRWLTEAQAASPGSPRLARELGLTLAATEEAGARSEAIALLERARPAYPEDYVSAATLGNLYSTIGDNARSMTRIEDAIDLQPFDLAVGEDSLEAMAERRYRLRRAHETLTRRDRITLTSSWSPTSPTPGIRSDPSNHDNDDDSGHDINTQVVQWDHALGHDPIHQGRELAGYMRAIIGGDDRDDYGRGRSLGLGLRAKPLARHNLNLYAEIFAESQKNDGEHTDYNLLLRATGSFLDQGDYSSEWRASQDQWNERSLYLDAAWWTQRGDVQLFGRYRQGRTFKLPTRSAQTLMPYASLQATSHDTTSWDEDVRLAAGLRWERWYDEDHYNAFRRKLSVSTEYQQSLGGNLYQERDGWMIHLELSL
ncbi:hypothetical protein TW86_00510 [Halomonas sp. S2151]|uniref:NfrA family protein n=1 Tax=Halomonas sp. S2151 TaxID=579478 RepID=UPI0005FA2EB0|nr:tetratricopeptide repeat protein [Halomonas sp. S2151]KJZ18391.1 hypothetical protein TW86_00510 [Halomonas sp. S2151]